MHVRNKTKSLLLLPLMFLVIAAFAERALVSHPTQDTAPDCVIVLGDRPEINPEQAVLTAMVERLSVDPMHPVRVVWRDDSVEHDMADRSATYYPMRQRLIDVSFGQSTIHEGVTLIGMRSAVRKGDRGATFSAARVASLRPMFSPRNAVPVAKSASADASFYGTEF